MQEDTEGRTWEGLVSWNSTWTDYNYGRKTFCRSTEEGGSKGSIPGPDTDEKDGRRIFCGRTEEGGLGRVPLANAMSLPATRPSDTGARQS